MSGTERNLTTLEKAEVAFLDEVENRGGVTIGDALLLNQEGTPIYFGTGIDSLDIVTKFLDMGYLEYQSDTGKFLRVSPEPVISG